ncbi:hypothetical protein AKAW_01348 [Aspergillus luchuensis IFO 4308]|nr:hypothetical protein ALUC_31323A [Aspergillus luchuensis]GAA83233.1 hypothetical protein AKAW_01348 [Aspergillus luchuensis IFO 4308]
MIDQLLVPEKASECPNQAKIPGFFPRNASGRFVLPPLTLDWAMALDVQELQFTESLRDERNAAARSTLFMPKLSHHQACRLGYIGFTRAEHRRRHQQLRSPS